MYPNVNARLNETIAERQDLRQENENLRTKIRVLQSQLRGLAHTMRVALIREETGRPDPYYTYEVRSDALAEDAYMRAGVYLDEAYYAEGADT